MHIRRLIKLSTVEEKTGQRKSWIYDQIREGNFPQQVRTGPGAVAWVESEVDAWIDARIAERDQHQPAAGEGKSSTVRPSDRRAEASFTPLRSRIEGGKVNDHEPN